MSVMRGSSDRLMCDVRACRQTFWAGSVFHAETTAATVRQAEVAGWWVSVEPGGPYGYQHLCPTHRHRAPGTCKRGENDV